MKKVKLNLKNVIANNIMMLRVFKREALKQNWTHQDVDAVLKEAKSGDYDHILDTLKKYCE